MASRYGKAVYEWLLERGWLPGPPLPPKVHGDLAVVDPHTNRQVDVYTAARLHKERAGEYPECLNSEVI